MEKSSVLTLREWRQTLQLVLDVLDVGLHRANDRPDVLDFRVHLHFLLYLFFIIFKENNGTGINLLNMVDVNPPAQCRQYYLFADQIKNETIRSII